VVKIAEENAAENRNLKNLRTSIDVLQEEIETQDIANRLVDHVMRNRIASMVSIADILTETTLDSSQTKWVRILKDIGNDIIKVPTSTKYFAEMEWGTYRIKLSNFNLVELIANETSELKELIIGEKADFTILVNSKKYEPRIGYSGFQWR